MGISTRLAVHDELDPSQGYLPLTRLVVGDIRLQATASELALEELTFAEVRTLEPGDRLAPEWAWSVGAALQRRQEFDCPTCLTSQVRGGFGRSLSLLGDQEVRDPYGSQWVAYALARGQAEVGGGMKSGQRVGAGIEIGSILDQKKIAVSLYGERLWWWNTVNVDTPWTQSWGAEVRFRPPTREWQLGVRLRRSEVAWRRFSVLAEGPVQDEAKLFVSYFPSL